MHYQWDLLPSIARHIEHGHADKAHVDLKELLHTVDRQSNGDLQLNKMRCAQIMATCMRAARLGGAAATGLLHEHFLELAQLSCLQSWTTCKRHLHRYLNLLLKQVDGNENDRIHRVVNAIREELLQDIQHSRSLAQYARELEMSEGHLSRSFSSIIGHSFSEEIQKIRLQVAQDLLANTTLSMLAIAEKIGLASASQFIADFRNQTGMTPGQFRRQ